MKHLSMRLLLCLCLPVMVWAGQVRADGHVPLARAFDAMRAGNWDSARAIASEVSPVAYDLIE